MASAVAAMDGPPPPPPPESPPPSSDEPASDQPAGDGAEEADASASPAGHDDASEGAEGAERDLAGVREQLRALKELNEEGLLNEAVYLMQQEILLAQLFGQPTPTLRLADASPPGLPTAAGEAEWAEPPPRGVLGPAGGAAQQRAGATETDSDDDAWPAGGPGPEADKLALPRPRGSRRRTRTTGRRAGESKQARRPKPGGRSRRAAGPPYRDDPIGPLPTTQPEPEPQADFEPEPEPEPNPEPAPAPKRRTALGVRGACRICGETSKCQCVHDDDGDAAPLPTTITERRPKEPRVAAAAPSATAALGTATSEYDFVAPTSEYLSLTKGCDVVVTGVHDEDWLLGYRVESEGRRRKKRKSRRFPSCCVVMHAETGDAGGGPLPTPTNDPPPPPAPDSEEEDFGAAENAPPPPLWDPTGAELGATGEAGTAAAGATEEPKGKGRVVTSHQIVQRRQVGSLSRLPFFCWGSRWLR